MPDWPGNISGRESDDGSVQMWKVRAEKDDVPSDADKECRRAHDYLCHLRQLQQPLEVLLTAFGFYLSFCTEKSYNGYYRSYLHSCLSSSGIGLAFLFLARFDSRMQWVYVVKDSSLCITYYQVFIYFKLSLLMLFWLQSTSGSNPPPERDRKASAYFDISGFFYEFF